MNLITKIINGLFIGDNSKPVDLKGIIEAITGNFKKSPQTTIIGLTIIVIGVLLVLFRSDLETLAFAMIGGGFSLLGIRDVWSKKNLPKNIKKQ